MKALYKEWVENFNDGDKTRELSDKILEAIEHSDNPADIKVRELGQYLVKRSQWIIGGDGASYDIGFGGLDHVIASGKNVNILVLDTEVYSNTGGQGFTPTPVVRPLRLPRLVLSPSLPLPASASARKTWV